MDRKIEKKHKWIKNVVWILVASLLVLLLLFTIIFGDKSSKLNVDKQKISTDEVRNDVFQDYIALNGSVAPISTIFLDAIEGGRVEEIIREEGSMLKKGDAILRLSNNNLILEISNNEALVARTVNELRQARLSMIHQYLSSESQLIDITRQLAQDERAFRYNKDLVESNHISKEEFEKSKEAYESSNKKYDLLLKIIKQDSLFRNVQVNSLESSVLSMEKNLELTKKRLENLLVKAPVDGELAKLNPEIGEVINYGSRIGTVNVLDSYKLRVEIDEHYIAKVRKGLTAECEFAGKQYPASITKIYPEVREGRFVVDMEFTESIPSRIRIGQTSRIRLELGESKSALLIARGGFYQSTGGQWVFVIDQSGEFAEKRAIKIGRQNPRYYEVLDGLSEGEQVIVSGYDSFGNADKLILKNR